MPVMRANTYEGENPKGWLMSEKLDGVRAVWNGRGLVTRNGNVILAPEWFTAALPAVALDGELWAGRECFQRVTAIIRGTGEGWQEITFRVFDAPEVAGGFETRLAVASDAVAGCSVASIVPHVVCAGRKHFLSFANDMISQGAEGAMLRKSGSKYSPRRSSSLLKFKPVETDEAEVVGYTAGKDSIRVVWQGLAFALKTALRPAIGASVTFQFMGLTDAGKPRHPSFITIRNYE